LIGTMPDPEGMTNIEDVLEKNPHKRS